MAINILSPKVFNRIAAGEVVERPASVVKELVENSLDAGATEIRVEIENGGISKISVSDNGCGISKEDLPLAFLPHATSKISSVDDLDEISTLGFRGEALASIASVSCVCLTTKQKNADTGYKISADGGNISKTEEVARLDGTTILVQNLFFNTPVRAKFLRKPKYEESEITHLVEKFMLARPDVAFRYIVEGKEVYAHASGKLDEVVYLLYGREIYDNLLPLSREENGIKVSGYVVSPKLTKPNRTYQSLFVNNRFVENYLVSACVQGAYEGVLMKGRFPIYVIKLEMPFDKVDVNVHPNKREVKFQDNSVVFGVIRRAVENALLDANLIAQFEYRDEKDWQKFDIENEPSPAMTGFDSFQKSKLDKLSPTEGASYQVRVDDDTLDEKIATPKDYQKKGIEIINMPDFSSVKSDKPSSKNRPGGNIFFDSPGASNLREVEIAVDREMNLQAIQKGENVVEEKFLKAGADEIKIVGTVFKTYIITEFEDSIYIVDQHAMHERQNFDRLKQQIEKHNVEKQDLLVPFEFNLMAKDSQIFAEKLKNLSEIGFDIKVKENNFQISAVPYVLSGINLQKFVEEILGDETLRTQTTTSILNERLCQYACKHSIRAGDSVGKDEIMFLINKIKDGVPLCPHGRPIIVKITRKELEKMFKRVL